MSVRGKWRVVETPDYDMAGPGSYILFADNGGEFALDCLTGSIHGRCEGDAVEFTWRGSDEMEPAKGHGWAEKLDDGSLEGEISLEGGDHIPFLARRSATSFNSLLGHFRPIQHGFAMSGYRRFCSLIPGSGVKLSASILAGPLFSPR